MIIVYLGKRLYTLLFTWQHNQQRWFANVLRENWGLVFTFGVFYYRPACGPKDQLGINLVTSPKRCLLR
jgi:hypothetical protein